ncbi:hypothetical protein PZB75_16075 [Streptomyces sp. AM 4-1-1]|uniref:hypothetical protein n=1 Tax=Streptomyces sp. AM 4-1-1 TaxID=3028710 RepID=UPI0023B9A223|nr:hypothetical protein [Streptomyces sp. AM 4-1-1]WEH34734.1 hypothetical protein PZB75_16075 [Streptomyces sp. AM 4-1-1]
MSSVPGSSGRSTIPHGADHAAWAVADAATRRLAAATVETLRTQETVRKLAQRYVNIANAQRAGHLFEVMHELSFNRRAIMAGSSVRARVTEWMAGGSQTAAADLYLVDGGTVVGEAQAKLMDGVTATAHQVSRQHYAGMTRLVAADRVAAVDDLLDRRLAMNPDGVRYADYSDARAHLSDRLDHGGVSSTPVDLADVHRAARNPAGWARGQAVRAVGGEALAAGAAGAAVGGLIGGITSAATQAARVRAGETSAACAAFTASAAAARAAVRSGSLASLGSLVRSAARAGRLPAVLGGGDLAFATARAAYAVAEAGLDLARGRIDTGEFAALSCEATLTTALTWGCGAVAQTVVPVPVVGALVGGLVGQATAALVVQGLQAALVAARAGGAEDDATELLERELLTASATSGLLSHAIGQLDDKRATHATAVVLPQLSEVRQELAMSDPVGALSALAELTCAVGGQPVFVTQTEFDRWMADEDAVLNLDPNW